MVSRYTNLINRLADRVYSILKSEPIDVIKDDESLVWESTWELTSPRDDSTTSIGSANMLLAKNVIIKYVQDLKDKTPFETGLLIFRSVLILLEAHKKIRQSPLIKRKGFKVISNDREKS